MADNYSLSAAPCGEDEGFDARFSPEREARRYKQPKRALRFDDTRELPKLNSAYHDRLQLTLSRCLRSPFAALALTTASVAVGVMHLALGDDIAIGVGFLLASVLGLLTTVSLWGAKRAKTVSSI